MKVSVSKIQNNAANLPFKKSNQAQPAFNGTVASTAQKSLKVLAHEAKDASYPNWLKKLIHLGNNNGEILNTVVTGIGTAFVAPIFIVWNPLAKEDKETRLYSAWRQPISAVLAVATQIAINKKFNNWMDKEASTGSFDRMNLTAKPRESYLRHIIKYQHPNWTKEQVQKEIKRKQNEAEWNAINSQRNLAKTDETFKNQIDNMSYEELVDKDAYKKAESSIKQEIEENIEQMKKEGKTSSEIKAYKNSHNKTFIENSAMKKAAEIMQQNVEIDTETKWIVRKYQLASEYLVKVEKAGADKDKLSKLSENLNPEVKEIVTRFNKYKKKNPTAQIADFALNDIQTQNELFNRFKFNQTQREHLREKMEGAIEYNKRELDVLKENLETASKDMKTIAEEQLNQLKAKGDFGSLKPLGNTREEILRAVKIKRLVKTQINKASCVLKESKTKWGIIVSLITLPFSCGLLNWVYPRLMEKIMPETAKRKKHCHKKMEAKA